VVPVVRDQRELRDDQDGASSLEDRPIEPAALVLEDPQVGDLPGKLLGVCCGVAARNPEQDAQARADLAARRDGRARDPLDDRSQLSSRSITREA
jgi:hypothetical protein